MDQIYFNYFVKEFNIEKGKPIDEKEAKKKWLNLSRIYHPDKFTPDPAVLWDLEEMVEESEFEIEPDETIAYSVFFGDENTPFKQLDKLKELIFFKDRPELDAEIDKLKLDNQSLSDDVLNDLDIDKDKVITPSELSEAKLDTRLMGKIEYEAPSIAYQLLYPKVGILREEIKTDNNLRNQVSVAQQSVANYNLDFNTFRVY